MPATGDDPHAICRCRICGDDTVPRTDLCRRHLTGDDDVHVHIDEAGSSQ